MSMTGRILEFMESTEQVNRPLPKGRRQLRCVDTLPGAVLLRRLTFPQLPVPAPQVAS